MLSRGQEGNAGKEIGVPERDLSRPQRLDDEALPSVVLQDQVAEEPVVGTATPNREAKDRQGSKV